MQTHLTWLLMGLCLTLLAGAAWMWLSAQRQANANAKGNPLPDQWTLTARPVFTVDERRVYRQLREALPQHVVLAKLPLVRFCQPIDPSQVRYWYDILGANHVSFAICSANGRVLAAIDLEQARHVSRRSVKIKQSVLAACKVRYLRCAPHEVPSHSELQLLVPLTGPAARAPHASPPVAPMRDILAAAAASRRRERPTLWQDSNFLQDSFFGGEGGSRVDRGTPSAFGAPSTFNMPPNSGFGSLRSGMSVREIPAAPMEAGGVVSDTAGSWLRH
jgi:cbb3-type cytochrome oxidase subunit 3